MIVGHYAAALIPYSRLKAYPFAVFAVGVLIWIPSATVSLREQLHAIGIVA
jgi:hypothetical protein